MVTVPVAIRVVAIRVVAIRGGCSCSGYAWWLFVVVVPDSSAYDRQAFA